MPIKITAKKDGFRRCGVAHPMATTTHPDDAFSKDQIDILMAEPALVVEIVQDDNPAEKKPGKKAKSEPGAE